MSNIYDEAIHVQDACNPSGVALFLVKCIKHIREVEGVTCTDKVREHPLFNIVVCKLDSMCGDAAHYFPPAYAACRARSEEHDHDVRDIETSKGLPGGVRTAADDDFIERCESVGRQPK